MPELPEVEVTRRALAPHVEGRTLEKVTVRDRRLRWPVPIGLEKAIARQPIERVDRRGKYLLWRLPHGVLISHLGMSGIWRVLPRARGVPLPQRHDHVDLLFAADCVRFTDPRRFGALLWHPARAGPVERHPLLVNLGIEPFDPAFDGAWLHRGTRGRDAAIKQVLLAGDVVVGVGNIYASESLFRAGIDPRTPARRISVARYARLADAIRTVLGDAIAVGGSTLRDFVGADGAQGYFMADATVYERAGQPCRICGAPITRIVQGQRATYFCRRCQRR